MKVSWSLRAEPGFLHSTVQATPLAPQDGSLEAAVEQLSRGREVTAVTAHGWSTEGGGGCAVVGIIYGDTDE